MRKKIFMILIIILISTQSIFAGNGDVDCNGETNTTDAMLTLRYSLGLDMSQTSWCNGEGELVITGLATDDMIVGTNQTAIISRLTLTANQENIVARDVLVEYTGTADQDDVIDKVILLDSDMLEIDNDDLNSDNEGSLNINETINNGESKIYFIGIRTSNTFTQNGLTGSIKVTKITTDGDDGIGTPILGATHEFNDNVVIDSFDAQIIQNQTENVEIGEENVMIATVNIENNSSSNDDEIVKSIKLIRTGTVGDDALASVKIMVNGVSYSAMQDDEEYSFNFGGGIILENTGDDDDFILYADIEDDSTKTFAFEISDIVVIDENENFLSQDDKAAPVGNADEISTQWNYGASVVTITNPTTTTVSISKTNDVLSHEALAGSLDEEISSFDVLVNGKNVDGNLEVSIVAFGNTEIEGDVDATAGLLDLADIDLNNLAVYIKDGSRISDKENVSFSVTPADGILDQVTYTILFNNVIFTAGNSAIDYVIKGDIGSDVINDIKYRITGVKYVSIEDVDGTDIPEITEVFSSPAEIIAKAADIEVSVEEADDTDINTDTDDVEVAQIKFDASNSGDDVKVTKVKLDIVVADTDLSGTDNDDLRNCELFDGLTSLSDKEDGGTSITFNVDFNITKDTEKNISVRCDIGSDFTNTDTITVTGVDFDATGVNTSTELDAAIIGNTTVTIVLGTPIFNISSDDANDDKVVRDTADDVVLGVYEFTAENGELNIDDITVTFTGQIDENIDGKIDIYFDSFQEASENPTAANPSVVAFTNLGKTVAKDETVTITFKADADTVGTVEINTVAMTVEETGVTVTTESSTGPAVEIVEALPVITQLNTDITNLDTADDVTLFAYSVKAEGGDITLGSTLLVATLNNASLTNAEIKIYDNAAMTGVPEAEVAFISGIHNDLDIIIPENDTYYVFLVSDVDVTTDTRSIMVQMYDDTTGVVFTTPDLTGDKIMEGDMESLLKQD